MTLPMSSATTTCWFCGRTDQKGCAICDDEYATVEKLRELVNEVWNQRDDFERRYRDADRNWRDCLARIDALRNALHGIGV